LCFCLCLCAELVEWVSAAVRSLSLYPSVRQQGGDWNSFRERPSGLPSAVGDEALCLLISAQSQRRNSDTLDSTRCVGRPSSGSSEEPNEGDPAVGHAPCRTGKGPRRGKRTRPTSLTGSGGRRLPEVYALTDLDTFGNLPYHVTRHVSTINFRSAHMRVRQPISFHGTLKTHPSDI
jgi:hypothetical protein